MRSKRAIFTTGATGLVVAGMVTATLPASFAGSHDAVVQTGATDLEQQYGGLLNDDLFDSELDEYWTDERIAAATPVELPPIEGPLEESDIFKTAAEAVANQKPVTPSIYDEPVEPTVPYAKGEAETAAVLEPKTFGRILFVDAAGNDKVCSGAVVNSESKSTVMTAAHCVYTPESLPVVDKDGNEKFGKHSYITFMPGYNDGPNADNGRRWRAKWWGGVRYSPQWEDGNRYYDQAFIEVRKKWGTSLVEKVGANGLAWGFSPDQKGARIWGHPVMGKYKGNEEPQHCDGDTRRFYVGGSPSNFAVIDCDFTGGGSGGPWFRNQDNKHANQIFAVTLTHLKMQNLNLAYPNDQRIKDLRDDI